MSVYDWLVDYSDIIMQILHKCIDLENQKK